jgi:hypothetical protein
MKDLFGLPPDDPQLKQARQAAHQQGPIGQVLDEMHPDGYWAEPGPGYNPKYRSTVWAIITLAQLGARVEVDPRLALACDYLVDQSMTDIGQFTASGAPSTTVDCLQGNLCAALVDLGWEDPRLEQAYDWLARSITGDGVAPNTERDAFPRYYAGNCGPEFLCGANNKLQCAWGAVFGFPIFYISDLLQVVEALILVGKGDDPRLGGVYPLVGDKQTSEGSWQLEYGYQGKMWVEFGEKKQPNKWVTIRAGKALLAAS